MLEYLYQIGRMCYYSMWIFLFVVIVFLLLIYYITSTDSENSNQEIEYQEIVEPEPVEKSDIVDNVIYNIPKIIDSDSNEVENTILIMEEDKITFKTDRLIQDIILRTQIYKTEITSDNIIRILDQRNEFVDFVYSDNSEKLQAIESHFKDLSEINKNLMIGFAKNIEEKNRQLISNDELVRLTKKFITKTNQTIFSNYYDYIVFERILLFFCPKGLFVLNIGETGYRYFGAVGEGFEHLVNVDALLMFVNEEFDKFLHVYNKHLKSKLSDREMYIFLWDFMKKVSVSLFSEQFESNYGHLIHECEDIEAIISNLIENSMINLSDGEILCLLTYYAIDKKMVDTDNFIKAFDQIYKEYEDVNKKAELINFEKMLLTDEEENKDIISIDDLDLLTGYEFEDFVGKMFKEMGYSIEVTRSSGDQGIDVIATKNSQKIGIQTKLYSKPVSNKAIQEVVAGLKHYNLDKGVVITNNFFTGSAKELATSNNVILWDRDTLKEKLKVLQLT